MDDDNSLRFIEFLSEARCLSHSGSHLLDHLQGTYRILQAWMVPEAVAIAGLIHSVYSTQFFRDGLFTIDERDDIRAVFGPDAERLAFYFCFLDRTKLWSEVVPRTATGRRECERHDLCGSLSVDFDDIRSLAAIECANFVEQSYHDDRSPALWMSDAIEQQRTFSDLIGNAVLRKIERLDQDCEIQALDIYNQCIYNQTPDLTLLLDCISLNPHIPELYYFAACELDRRDDAMEASNFRAKALSLRRMWGRAWDRRVEFEM
ncbi:hypothetical protein V1T76_08725 [Roseibium sp. FZY0029]|uniref:DUF6817 domain-containing protein n=1 Tax=Roseibium sp. FZY0029 TaxID=3116647 RepID=UPI002EBEAFF8|nr:hypothetical protein [Roseibium sp. FZY0029]